MDNEYIKIQGEIIMWTVKEMLKDFDDDYEIYLSERRGVQYVFMRLWDEFYDNAPDEEMTVCNLIIARMNLKASYISDNHKRLVKRYMSFYKNNENKIRSYYSEEDIKLIEEIVDEINSKQNIWNM